MKIDRCVCVVYSPTGTTKKVVRSIVDGIGEKTTVIDITSKAVRENECSPFAPGDIAVIGAPVYLGTIPANVREYIKGLTGNGALAVVVAVYGNRAYDNALYDLGVLCEEAGFSVAAGGVFIGEHTMSSQKKPIQAGRPDENDCRIAYDFGADVRGRIADAASLEEIGMPAFPHRAKAKSTPMPQTAPRTNTDVCVLCGQCAALCPTGAITMNEDRLITDKSKCTACYACIKGCPQGARSMKNLLLRAAGAVMYRTCAQRKEPELF